MENERPPHDHHAGSFMSCSAWLPVYGLLTAAFPNTEAGGSICWDCSSPSARASSSRSWFSRRARRLLVLNRAPYRLPTSKTSPPRGKKVKGFLVKAGTLILAMSAVFCSSSLRP